MNKMFVDKENIEFYKELGEKRVEFILSLSSMNGTKLQNFYSGQKRYIGLSDNEKPDYCKVLEHIEKSRKDLSFKLK